MADWDVVVIGRSYAGLSAALVLGRVRRSVLVVGDGPPRNEAAAHAHGLLTRDHTPAGELIAAAEADLARYDTVVLQRGHVDELTTDPGDGFLLRFGDRTTTAATVVLATGVNDDIPAIPGLADRWGRGVYTCPFCDGFEHADRPWGLVGVGDHLEPAHLALFGNWASSLTVFHPDGDGSIAAAVEASGVEHGAVESRAIVRVSAGADDGVRVELADGDVVELGAIFLAAVPVPNSALARQLGCDLDPAGFVRVDALGATSVDRVYAIGDVTRVGPHQITLSAADGLMAASAITKRHIADQLAAG